jgi:hypothetical protein
MILKMMSNVGLHLYLLLGFTLKLFAIVAEIADQLSSLQKTETTLKICVLSPDSSDIRYITSLMQNIPENDRGRTVEKISTKSSFRIYSPMAIPHRNTND